MVKNRDLVIAVLIAFCLTAMLFSVRFTGSQAPGQYDPWLDINDDGKILIEDVAWVAKAFGTSGDPTKNVTITSLNHYSSVDYFAVQPPTGQGPTYRYFSIEGFRQVSLNVIAVTNSSHDLWIEMGSYNHANNGSYYDTVFEVFHTINGTTSANSFTETLAVQGPELRIAIWPSYGQTSADWFTLGVYVTC